jgi:hypothetical protein
MFTKGAPSVDLKESDIFPEITILEKHDEDEEEKKEEEEKLSPGAASLLLYANSQALKARQAALDAHLKRVAELEKNVLKKPRLTLCILRT